MDCRPQCGACCIAPAIRQPFWGMPDGKPAGVACLHLLDNAQCDYTVIPGAPQSAISSNPSPLSVVTVGLSAGAAECLEQETAG